VKASLGDDAMTAESLQSLLGDDASFEYVWDNASKKPEGAGKAICDCAKSWGTKVFTYVSSAGMYLPTGVFPMPETTPVKESAGQNLFDNYAVEIGLPLVSFRPQYIYGPKSNKYDYIDWYFDRLCRDLPLPIPGDGTQKVSLTNSEDVASLLSSVLDNEEAAIEQRFFNCGTDELVSYDDVAYLCAKAAGIPNEKVMIEHYDSELFGKANFPFRLTDFYVSPDTAKDKLGWSGPSTKLADAMEWYYEGYKARGGVDRDVDLMKDYEIVVASRSSYKTGSIYDQYLPLGIDTSNVKKLNVEI
jgi:nucleoside-diphosphate-sugar epimerase